MKDFNALVEARLERLEEDVHFLKVIVLMLSVCGLLGAIGNLVTKRKINLK